MIIHFLGHPDAPSSASIKDTWTKQKEVNKEQRLQGELKG